MKYIVSAEKMKQIDASTIRDAGIPSMVLMERAALAVVDLMKQKINKEDRILAVCGTGNNAGDGIAVARILKHEGYNTSIYIIGDEKRATEQTKQQLLIARNFGIPVLNNAKISEYNVIVDAVVGIGLSKEIAGTFYTTIKEINQSSNLVFSVDIPSGISADDGQIFGIAVKADYTVTFGLMKIGLLLYPGAEYAGEIHLADIGFADSAIEKAKVRTFIYEKSDLDKLPFRNPHANKGTFGKVLIIAGSKNMSGACYLSAKAAYRSGAGLVKVLTVEQNRSIMQALLPEALLETYDSANLKNKLEVDRIIRHLQWATSIVIGPGIGLATSSDYLLDIVLHNTTVPIIVDADAISMLSGKKEYVSDHQEKGEVNEIDLPSNVILTPHLKEMARLLDCATEEVMNHLMETAYQVTCNKKFVLALKDARTIVTDGDSMYLNVSGNNGMATGGSGDVLTGIIAALIAQGLSKFDATTLGVYIHGLAADEAIKDKSVYALIASDIIEALPMVLP